MYVLRFFQVTFNPNVQILKMCDWKYVYMNARKDKWMEIGRDRERFRRMQKIE